MKQQGKYVTWAVTMALAACTCTSATGCADQNDATESSTTAQTAADATDASAQTEENPEEDAATAQTLSMLNTATRAEYDEDDLTSTYDHFDSEISFDGDQITVTGDSSAVSVDGTAVTILKGGTYSMTGTLADGKISVTGDDKVKLYLNGVSITNTEGAAISCTNEKRTILSLAEGTENTLTDGGSVEDSDDAENAALYAKDKLTINGSGTLTVNGTCKDGIVCQDDLKITGGTIAVDAVNNGIKGKDSFAMCGGNVTVTAGNDGIKSTKTDDTEKGWVAFDGGTITITSGGDGIQAETTLEIADGTFTITTNGEIDATSSQDGFGFGGGGFGGGGDMQQFDPSDITIGEDGEIELPDGSTITIPDDMELPDGSEMPQMPDGGGDMPQGGGDMPQGDGDMPQGGGDMQTPPEQPDGAGDAAPDGAADTTTAPADAAQNTQTQTTTTTDSTTGDETEDEDTVNSSKGIKSGDSMTVTGGSIQIVSTDHCVHATGEMQLSGGSFDLTSSLAKGISGHEDVTISGADTAITISQCTEGIESKAVLTVEDGNIRILDASDDGMNAGGMGSSDHIININGGTIYVNAEGDGIDSNGAVNFNGGILIVSGPVSGNDGSLDGDGEMNMNGGIVLGLSSRGMLEYPSTGCMLTSSLNASAGDMLAVLDSDGNVLTAIQLDKQVTDVIYCNGDVEDLTTCRLEVGGTFTGTLNEDGWATSGTWTDGTACDWSESDGNGSGFGGGGMGGGGNGGGMGDMQRGDGFGGRNGGGFGGGQSEDTGDDSGETA
jgi:hypothetical protein